MASGSHVADVPDDIAEEADAAAQDCKKGSISIFNDIRCIYILLYILSYILTCSLTNTTFRPLTSPTTLANLHEESDLHPPNMSTNHLIPNSCCHSAPKKCGIGDSRIESISDRLVLWRHGGGGNHCWKTTQLLSPPSQPQLKAADHSWQMRWGHQVDTYGPESRFNRLDECSKKDVYLEISCMICRQICVSLWKN